MKRIRLCSGPLHNRIEKVPDHITLYQRPVFGIGLVEYSKTEETEQLDYGEIVEIFEYRGTEKTTDAGTNAGDPYSAPGAR